MIQIAKKKTHKNMLEFVFQPFGVTLGGVLRGLKKMIFHVRKKKMTQSRRRNIFILAKF